MPAIKKMLSDTQAWQVSQFLAHSNELAESISKLLAPDVPASKANPK
jgi:hypothetical protein